MNIEYKMKPQIIDNHLTYMVLRRKNEGRWFIVWGNMSHEEASDLLKSPDQIEFKVKSNRVFYVCIIIFLVSMLIWGLS